MNREDIFRLAESFNTLRTEWVFNEVKLQQFFWAAYRTGAAAEREACAKLCANMRYDNIEKDWSVGAALCAEAIRARSEK